MTSLTKRIIMESCVKLLEERPLSKVTVKDIVEDCGINRNTFYYHFADMPSLLEALLQVESERIIAQYHGISSLEECLEAAMAFAKDHRQAIFHVYNSANRELLERYLMKNCDSMVREFVDTISKPYDISPADREAIVLIYRCEFFGHVIDWLNNNMSDSLQQELMRACELRRGMAEELCRRSAQGV